MSATGLEVFDRTIHKTNVWLKDLMEIQDCPDRHEAYLALRATLHALRDRLTIKETVQLAAQLPMLIRGFYYEGWDPTGNRLRSAIERSSSPESSGSSHAMKSTLNRSLARFSL